MKSSPSKPQLVLVEQSSRASIPISTSAFYSLAKKAGRNKVLLSILEQVYCRGVLSSVPSGKNTPEQQAFARVNSFLNGGKACEIDADLVEALKVPDGTKHIHIIKKAIENHRKRNKTEVKESVRSVIGSVIIGAMGGHPRTRRTSTRSSTRSSTPKTSAEKFQYKPDEGEEKYIKSKGATASAIVRYQNEREYKQRQEFQGKRLKADQERETYLASKMQDYAREDEERRRKKLGRI